MQARRFYLDTQTRQFVGGFDRSFPASSTSFFQEDVEDIELYFLEPTGDFSAPYRGLDYSGNTVKLAVGLTAPAALQTSWTSLSTSIAASVSTLVGGGNGANEVQRVSFSGRQPASGGFALTIPTRTLGEDTLESVTGGIIRLNVNHGFFNGQAVQIGEVDSDVEGVSAANGFWYVRNRTNTSFQISQTLEGDILAAINFIANGIALPAFTTPQIPYNASAADVQQAFVTAGLSDGGIPQISVSGSFEAGFTCEFVNGSAGVNFGQMTVGSTLAASPALSGSLSLNTNEVAALIAAGTNGNLRMEVEVAGSGKRQTYSTTASVADDMIVSASTSPVPVGTAASFALTDGGGGVWVVTVDANGILTTAKQ
jgi:hypothetical protein